MHVYNRKETETKSGHSSFNRVHSVKVCVCACACSRDGKYGKHSADAADFLPEGEKRRDKKRKIDTAARF